MPLPKPTKGESEKDFVARCAGNKTMNSEFPDSKQRVAVCHELFRKKRSEDEMETRAFNFEDFEVREEDGEGVFEGRAVIFEKKNSHGEIFERGAFKEAIKTRGVKGIKMLFSHDRASPIGKWEEIREDRTGLFVRGRLLMKLQKAQEAFLLMKEDILDGLSIGFRPVEESFNNDKGAFIVRKADLREISPVLIPSDSGALISKVRDASPDEIRTERELEKALRDAGFSRAFSQYIVSGWTPPALRDAEGGIAESIRTLTKSLRGEK